jgi:hypothetical protein
MRCASPMHCAALVALTAVVPAHGAAVGGQVAGARHQRAEDFTSGFGTLISGYSLKINIVTGGKFLSDTTTGGFHTGLIAIDLIFVTQSPGATTAFASLVSEDGLVIDTTTEVLSGSSGAEKILLSSSKVDKHTKYNIIAYIATDATVQRADSFAAAFILNGFADEQM